MKEELIKLDSTFNEAMFITKVDNIYIMILSSIMSNNLDKVRHFIGNTLEEKYDLLINDFKKNNQRQIYEMPNVKSTQIINVDISEEKYIIKVELISRYIDYIIDLNTNKALTNISE